MFKILLNLVFISITAFSCPIYDTPIPMADIHVNIDSKKSNTSFEITWKFKEFYIQSLLLEHDKNKNGKFDKDEQDEIKNELIKYVEENNYITDIVYVEKDQRIKKSLAVKLNIISSSLVFTDDKITYTYNFDTDFILSENHRLFIRFLDQTERIQVNLQEVVINNYNGPKVILPQDIRANIYFYNYVPKYRKTLNISKHDEHKH